MVMRDLTQLERDSVNVGVWIMPNNQREGQLEDLILQMIRLDGLVISDAKWYIDNLHTDLLEPDDYRLPKHYTFAWLSAHYPGDSFDRALQCKLLEFPEGNPNFDAFFGWLRRLVN